jgi:putative transposase
VSPVPLGSKESHDPPIRWLRAKSLHSIMNDHKMIEMKV